MNKSLLRLRIGSLISLVVLIFVGSYSYFYFSKANDAEKWVTHTQEVIGLLDTIHGHVANAETNQRGFMLTGQDDFLNELANDKIILSEQLKELTAVVPDNKTQIQNIEKLRALVKTRMDSLDYVIGKMKESPAEAIAFVRSGVSLAQMRDVRAHIRTMREIEEKLLDSRLIDSEEQTQAAGIMIIASIILAVFTTGSFAWLNIQDLKRRFQMEKELRRAEKEAQGANRAKSDFLANMSHEIRTPMNAIIGMADLLIETPLNEDQKRYVQIFQRSGHNLLSLINDILDLSKVEAEQLELEMDDFSISDILFQISELVAIKAHQKNIEFIILIDPDLHDYYIGDANRIRQVILNLVNNSIKFTDDGEVVIRVSAPQDKKENLVIEISDTGIGMTKDQVSKVFDRFTQAHEKISSKFGGTGLGLSISKKLIELMGGSISIESRIAEGTTLTIHLTLPISDTAPLPQIPLNVDLRNKNALIVDDNPHNRLILRQILQKQEVNIEEAVNGEDALQKVKDFEKKGSFYDFILMDGRMPDIDGFTVTEKLKQQGLGHDAIIMMLTSDQRAGDIQRSKDLGIKGYLVKPISIKDFNMKLGQAFGVGGEKPKAANLGIVTDQKVKILVVDDNQDNRSLIEAYFKGSRYIPTMAVNGQEAINEVKKNNYDLILMDIQMPVMDGLEATRHIRELQKSGSLPSTPIIALSAYALKEEKEKSIQAGCDLHLSKPIKKADLLKALTDFIPTTEQEGFIAKVEPDLKEMANQYILQKKEEVALLKNFLKEKDFKNLFTLGHKMRGVAESYGFPELTQYGEQIENAAKAEEVVTISENIEKIEYYLSNVKIEVEG